MLHNMNHKRITELKLSRPIQWRQRAHTHTPIFCSSSSSHSIHVWHKYLSIQNNCRLSAAVKHIKIFKTITVLSHHSCILQRRLASCCASHCYTWMALNAAKRATKEIKWKRISFFFFCSCIVRSHRMQLNKRLLPTASNRITLLLGAEKLNAKICFINASTMSW